MLSCICQDLPISSRAGPSMYRGLAPGTFSAYLRKFSYYFSGKFLVALRFLANLSASAKYRSNLVHNIECLSSLADSAEYLSNLVGNLDCLSNLADSVESLPNLVYNINCLSSLADNAEYLSDLVGNV
jgi:hypothetical protein